MSYSRKAVTPYFSGVCWTPPPQDHWDMPIRLRIRGCLKTSWSWSCLVDRRTIQMSSNHKRHIIFSHVDLKKQKSLPEDVTAKKSGAMVNIYVYMSWKGRPSFFIHCYSLTWSHSVHYCLYLSYSSTFENHPYSFSETQKSWLWPTNLALVMQLAKVSRTTSSEHDWTWYI
jgi:hypothetical protein